MAVNKYCLLLCVFCCWCCVSCDLNLSENATCVTQDVKGKCVRLSNCPSAALNYLYREAGYDPVEYKFPELPEICLNEGEEPIVCCTDCRIERAEASDSFVGPLGDLVNKTGPVAWKKCYEYFKRLPYPCRGSGPFSMHRIWIKSKQCFELNYATAVFVLNGTDAQKWEFPHMALLGYGDTAESADWLCGGSIISERFILTAAHCSSTNSLGSIKYAALGLLRRTDPKENWKIYNIKRIIVHPEYKSPSKYHDIALLETETEINFGRDLLPACLDIYNKGTFHAEAAGWGRLGYKQDLADTLQKVVLMQFNETECSTLYPPHRHLLRGYDHQTQMCYGSHYHLVDTCDGDSGGPLQWNDLKCLYHIVGVTSYGKDCGILGSAGMYTRVSYYVPWIESIVWPNETNSN